MILHYLARQLVGQRQADGSDSGQDEMRLSVEIEFLTGGQKISGAATFIDLDGIPEHPPTRPTLLLLQACLGMRMLLVF